jgi:hypothetical protein
MAKDRNTLAKHDRERAKKRKAAGKRECRAEKKKTADESGEPGRSQFLLTASEQCVLRLFRDYLMTPGRMLCLRGTDLETHNDSLAELTGKGLLVAEIYEGGYSLTAAGFAAMNRMVQSKTRLSK